MNKPYHMMKADERIEEQNRVIQMLQAQRDKEQKSIMAARKFHERQVKEMQAQIE